MRDETAARADARARPPTSTGRPPRRGRGRAPACLGLSALLLAGASGDGEIYVDPGACPGEGCHYGETWTAREPIPLRAAPDASSDPLATLVPGEQVDTLTGEVHTRPGRFLVRQPHGAFQPGDLILLYTYLGEGWYRARHNGAEIRVDLGMSPWDRRCRSADDDRCWGVLETRVRFWWWVRVRRASGREGWVLDSRALEKPGLH